MARSQVGLSIRGYNHETGRPAGKKNKKNKGRPGKKETQQKSTEKEQSQSGNAFKGNSMRSPV
jgi:hypothetical protein